MAPCGRSPAIAAAALVGIAGCRGRKSWASHPTPNAYTAHVSNLPGSRTWQLSRRRRFMARAHHCGPPCASTDPTSIDSRSVHATASPALRAAPFRPRLLDHLRAYTRNDFVHDLGAGITVGVIALPLAMAFAIASGVKPEQGIVTAIVAGFLISALGGSSVQIGGPPARSSSSCTASCSATA
jgi:hypothetical protein